MPVDLCALGPKIQEGYVKSATFYLSKSRIMLSHSSGKSDAIFGIFGNGVASLSSAMVIERTELPELAVLLAADRSLTVARPWARGTIGLGASSPSCFGIALSTKSAWTEPTDSTKMTTGLLLELTSFSSLLGFSVIVEPSDPSALEMLSKKERLIGPEASEMSVPKSCPLARPRMVIEEEAGLSRPRIPLSVTNRDSP